MKHAAEVSTGGMSTPLEAIGVSMGRIAALNSLMRDGPASTGRIAADIGATVNATWRHLTVLERAGLVSRRHATHPRGLGRITYWSAPEQAGIAILDHLEDELLRGVQTE